MKIGYFTILFSHPWQKGAAMYSETLLQEVFEPGYVPSLIYSAKQAYGKQRHDRPMHQHESLCELLLCYRGFGTS